MTIMLTMLEFEYCAIRVNSKLVGPFVRQELREREREREGGGGDSGVRRTGSARYVPRETVANIISRMIRLITRACTRARAKKANLTANLTRDCFWVLRPRGDH